MSIVEGSSSTLRVGMRSPGRLAFLSRNSHGSMPRTLRAAGHLQLDRERRRGHAEAAHGGRRHVVRPDDVGLRAQRRHRVGAGQVEGVLRRAVAREARVGAGVVQRQHLAAEDPAVLRERVGHLDVPGGAHAAAEHLLLAREDPAHRAAGLEREDRGEGLGGRVDLAAEAAADRAADELDAAGSALQMLGEHAHREVHRLGAGVDGQPAVALGHDQAALRLDRGLLDRARAVASP